MIRVLLEMLREHIRENSVPVQGIGEIYEEEIHFKQRSEGREIT